MPAIAPPAIPGCRKVQRQLKVATNFEFYHLTFKSQYQNKESEKPKAPVLKRGKMKNKRKLQTCNNFMKPTNEQTNKQ